MSAMITEDWQIALFALQQAKHRLRLEINTGMRFKSSTVKALRSLGYTSARNNVGALTDLEYMLEKIADGKMVYDSSTHRWKDVGDV
jgi:hypothetical protein